MSVSRPFARAIGMIGALALVAAGFVGLTALASPAAHAANGVTVTVTPSTGLTDGEQVHVVGKGFTPNAGLVAVLQCGPQVADPDVGQKACNVPGVGLTSADGNGTAETDITVKTGQVGTDPDSICPPPAGSDPCVIQAANVGNQDENASAPIFFGTGGGTASDVSADLTMPDRIKNDNTAGAKLGIKLANNGSGGFKNIETDLSLSLPNGINCTDVTITADPDSTDTPPRSPLTSSSPTSPCTYDIGQYALNDTVDYLYDITVNGKHAKSPPTTGTIDGTLSVYQQDDEGFYVSTLATDKDSSQLTTPHAPSFNAAPTNSATLYHRYSYDLVKSQGFPEADKTDSSGSNGYFAFGSHQNADGSYDYTGQNASCTTTNGKQDCVIVLKAHGEGGQFEFDTTTGKIESIGATNDVNPSPYWTWTIIANNGYGGASSSDTTTGPSNGKPQVLVHDVDSDPFTLPVLFGDVPLSSDFAQYIYPLANNGVIKGYGDGNYKSGNAITRRAFVTFEMRVLNVLNGDDVNDHTGACKPGKTSGYSDVGVNSQFCQQIRQLTRDGVINGYDDGTFQPGNHVTRRAIAAFLFRLDSYLKGAEVGDAECTTPTGYNDVNENTAFCGDIEWLTDHEITTGYDDGGFHPGGDTTRRAGAAFFYRFGNYEHAGTF